MAAKRSPSRHRPKAPAPPSASKRAVQRTVRATRWGLVWSRPRTAAEALAFALTLLGITGLFAISFNTVTRFRLPGLEVLWTVPLFVMALAARFSPWWRAELQSMTAARARNYLGTGMLLYAALSLCVHGISVALGLGSEYPLLGRWSTSPGSIVVLLILIVVAVSLILGVPIHRWAEDLYRGASGSLAGARERRTLALATVDSLPVYGPEPGPQKPEGATLIPRPTTGPHAIKAEAEQTEAATASNGSELPPVDMFAPPVKGLAAALDLDSVSKRIQDTLASFNVGARVVDRHCGPVITRFDIQPDRGVKVKSIVALQNDLALALAAPTIRIQAPVPGKPVVGIEIPNTSATMVTLRELLESNQFRSMQSPLKVVLGKDVAGHPAVIDLAKMPHLLIAGATGSGKSVCVNALISCLIYSNTPEQVRLMMVDPKMVELSVYNGVPHLLSPVVTEMDKVVGVLQWGLREMERRYQLFKSNAVRNIGRYNEKMTAAGVKPLPYIVFIVDELADLMMMAPEEVEEAICRLAQLARAAGIHLVIATQRPSVDVVTGLIKANFTARIAFNMTSQVDSRTILDSAGAEKLLGRGDMLYMPPDAAKPVRLQGAHVSDQEIERLVEFWQRSPLQKAVARIAEDEFVAAEKAAVDAGDELLGEAIRTVREFQHASVSLLQRRLKIGYSRAARLMDQLEERGVVGQADGSKQRPVMPEEEAPSS